MSRKSYQKGYVSNPIRTKDGLKFVIRNRQRTSEGKWRHKAETLYGLSGKKAAQAKLDERIRKSSPQETITPTPHLTLPNSSTATGGLTRSGRTSSPQLFRGTIHC